MQYVLFMALASIRVEWDWYNFALQ